MAARLASLRGSAEQAYKAVLKTTTGGASPHKFIVEMMEKNKVRSNDKNDVPREVCGYEGVFEEEEGGRREGHCSIMCVLKDCDHSGCTGVYTDDVLKCVCICECHVHSW